MPAIAAAAQHDALARARSRSASTVSRSSSSRICVPIGTGITTSGAAAPVRSLPGAVAALRRPEMLRVAEIDQRIEVLGRDEHDVAALAAIAAVRPAELDELLAPKRHHAVPAIAGAEVDLRLIKELHNTTPKPSPPGRGLGEGQPAPTAGPEPPATRPLRQPAPRPHAPGPRPCAWNFTCPSTSAKMRVVAPEPDVRARLHLGAALADDDVARDHRLAAELLDAEPPALGIAPVAATSRLLSYVPSVPLLTPARLRGRLRLDRHRRLGGGRLRPSADDSCPSAMIPATRSTVTCWRCPFLRRLFCRRRFLKMITLSSRSCAITVADTRRTRHERRADRRPGIAADRQHFGEGDGLARATRQLLDLQHVVRLDAVLLSAGADDRKHRLSYSAARGNPSCGHGARAVPRSTRPLAGRRALYGPAHESQCRRSAPSTSHRASRLTSATAKA